MDKERGALGLTQRELLTVAIVVPVAIVAVLVAGPHIKDLVGRIIGLPAIWVYLIVGILVFAEDALFFGFIFPGETAVILGGVAASAGHANIVVLTVIVVIAAIGGDTVGYWIGREFGDKVLSHKLLDSRRGGLDSAFDLLRRRGAVAVFIGRFTAFFRAVMPALAGTSRMHYRTFLAANAAGGLVWGVGFSLLGYFVGSAYTRAERYASWVQTGILVVIVLVGAALFIRGRRKEAAMEHDFEHRNVDPKRALEEDLADARDVPEDDRTS
jgi:membrane protein DedA with SNARE-associated domain